MEEKYQRANPKKERKRYLAFLYFGGLISFIVMIFTIIAKNVYADPNSALISEPADTILFEILIIVSGTIFGSTIIGVLIDQYQRRFSDHQDDINRFVLQIGIIDVFNSAVDPRLIQHLLRLIPSARSEIVFSGLGLGILSHNFDVLDAIGKRLNAVKSLRTDIFIGGSGSLGVMNRVSEEKIWHEAHGLSYSESWVTRYPAEIKSYLQRVVDVDAIKRLRIVEVDDCPMCTVIKIDDDFLFFSYGSPNIRGSQSPWMAFDGKTINSKWVQFLSNIISFYRSTYTSSHETNPFRKDSDNTNAD